MRSQKSSHLHFLPGAISIAVGIHIALLNQLFAANSKYEKSSQFAIGMSRCWDQLGVVARIGKANPTDDESLA